MILSTGVQEFMKRFGGPVEMDLSDILIAALYVGLRILDGYHVVEAPDHNFEGRSIRILDGHQELEFGEDVGFRTPTLIRKDDGTFVLGWSVLLLPLRAIPLSKGS